MWNESQIEIGWELMRGRNSIWGATFSRSLAMKESREVTWEVNRDDVGQRRTLKVRDTRACWYVDGYACTDI